MPNTFGLIKASWIEWTIVTIFCPYYLLLVGGVWFFIEKLITGVDCWNSNIRNAPWPWQCQKAFRVGEKHTKENTGVLSCKTCFSNNNICVAIKGKWTLCLPVIVFGVHGCPVCLFQVFHRDAARWKDTSGIKPDTAWPCYIMAVFWVNSGCFDWLFNLLNVFFI